MSPRDSIRSSGTRHLAPTLKHKSHETDARSVIQGRIPWLEQGGKFRLWSHHRLVICACVRGLTIRVPVIWGTGPPQGQKHWKMQVGISWKYYRDLVAFRHFQRGMTLTVGVILQRVTGKWSLTHLRYSFRLCERPHYTK